MYFFATLMTIFTEPGKIPKVYLLLYKFLKWILLRNGMKKLKNRYKMIIINIKLKILKVMKAKLFYNKLLNNKINDFAFTANILRLNFSFKK